MVQIEPRLCRKGEYVLKTIAIFNQKGGVGKTTTVANIAGCLCENKKKKVLVVDCDGQCNITNYLLSIVREVASEPSNKLTLPSKTLTDYFIDNKITFDDMVHPVYVKKANKPVRVKIDLLPISNSIDFVNVSDIELLRRLLSGVESRYDYCLIDCPPHLSDVALNALCASDYIVVPSLADDDSLGGYGLLVDSVNKIRSSGYNVGLEIVGVLLNNMPPASAFEKYVYALMNKSLKHMLFSNYVRSSNFIRQARHFGMPLIYYRPKASICEDYIEVTDELIRKINMKKRT